jgi:UTP:GlnB (protein PII) uridylyltransferase
VAAERVHQELFLLLGAASAAKVLEAMEAVGLLSQVFPELDDMKGVEQNGSHHLDVYDHSLAAMACLEEAAAPEAGQRFIEGALAAQPPNRAPGATALFTDAGAPGRRRSHPERYTFYFTKNGVEIFSCVARRGAARPRSGR